MEDITLPTRDPIFGPGSYITPHPLRCGMPKTHGKMLAISGTLARETRADSASHTQHRKDNIRRIATLLPIQGESIEPGMRQIGFPREVQEHRGPETSMNLQLSPVIPAIIIQAFKRDYAATSTLKQEKEASPRAMSDPEANKNENEDSEEDDIGSEEGVGNIWWHRWDQMQLKPEFIPPGQLRKDIIASIEYSDNDKTTNSTPTVTTPPATNTPAHRRMLAERWANDHGTKIRPHLPPVTTEPRDPLADPKPKMEKRPLIQKIETPQGTIWLARGDTWDAIEAARERKKQERSQLIVSRVHQMRREQAASRQCTMLPPIPSSGPMYGPPPFDSDPLHNSDPRLNPQSVTVTIPDCCKIRVEVPLTPEELIDLAIRRTWIVIVRMTLQCGFLWEGGQLWPYLRNICLETFVKIQYFETDTDEEGVMLRETLSGYMMHLQNDQYAWKPERLRGPPAALDDWQLLPLNVTEGHYPSRRSHGLEWPHQVVTGYTGPPGFNEVRPPAVNPPWKIYARPPWKSFVARTVGEAYNNLKFKFPLVRRLAKLYTPPPPLPAP